jgi:ribokinase
MVKILNFGSLNIDYVYAVDHFVEPGETLPSRELFINCGGKGLNQSIAAQKAGCQVYHAGLYGVGGELLLQKLEKNRVDIGFMEASNEPNGHAIIQVDSTGQNSILLYGGTNQLFTEAWIDKTLDTFGNEGLVLVQNETNLVGYIIEQAHKRGLKTALNAAPMDKRVVSYPLDLLDWLMVNEVEGRQLLDREKKGDEVSDNELLSALQRKYEGVGILLTLGSKGAICTHDGITCKIGSHPITPVDTTAAGDTFTGFFLYAVLSDQKIEKALTLASAASALAIGKKGASDSIPTKEDVEIALKEGNLEKLKVEIF